MTIWYHASDATITDLDRDICLARYEDEARPYAPNGRLYSVEIGDMRIAYVSDLQDAAAAVGVEDETGYPYDLADSKKVRAQLVREGFGAIRYDDVGPQNAYRHDTLRLLPGHTARLIGEA